MKPLLLSLCLVGAVFPGHTRLALQTGPPTSTVFVEARAVLPQPNFAVERTAVRSLAIGRDTQAITSPGGDKARLPTPGESFEPSALPVPDDENEEVNWVVVIRGARVHSGPSVSAPTVRFYSVGTELHLINYKYGWFQVLDPVTSQRGWIYAKYYLQAIRGPGQLIAALQEPAKPQQKMVNAGKPSPHVRRAKKIGPRPEKKVQPSVASAPRYRHETVVSILDRALRP